MDMQNILTPNSASAYPSIKRTDQKLKGKLEPNFLISHMLKVIIHLWNGFVEGLMENSEGIPSKFFSYFPFTALAL